MDMEFEHPLRRYRREHGLTLEQLATRAGTSFVTISRIEGRRQQASHRLLIRLSEATSIPIEDLVRASSAQAA
jgi:transcriptional regulator with XRE-family HTH domain